MESVNITSNPSLEGCCSTGNNEAGTSSGEALFTPLFVPPSILKTVCSWCNAIMVDGPPSPVSHGLCARCSSRINTELDASEALKAAA